MTARRWIRAVLWLYAGHLAVFGVYVALLYVPESNVLTLIGSALLTAILVAGLGIVDTTGLLWLRPEWTWRRAIARSVRVLPAFLVALALCWFLAFWLNDVAMRYHAEHGSQLDAWLIATFDWTSTGWLHPIIRYGLLFGLTVVGISLAVALVSMAAAESGADVLGFRWILRGLHWRQLAIVAVAFIGLMWLPSHASLWRPAWLSPNWTQVAFAVTKLGILLLVIHVGWAMVLWAPQRVTGRRSAPPEPAATPAPPIGAAPDVPPPASSS